MRTFLAYIYCSQDFQSIFYAIGDDTILTK